MATQMLVFRFSVASPILPLASAPHLASLAGRTKSLAHSDESDPFASRYSSESDPFASSSSNPNQFIRRFKSRLLRVRVTPASFYDKFALSSSLLRIQRVQAFPASFSGWVDDRLLASRERPFEAVRSELWLVLRT
ncbi:hypothetical protein RHMOL_Rhmol01G0103000 [Rhododendron molle]|uniref:Uncharacterized protein n=1 Tax=Rhododendron molle TaxID=49168 RepID=A0ACC0Q0G6_RHOML|nr:hypothetical protein RHMOL_Rhmol01G0103000 [Rhododendron molle]